MNRDFITFRSITPAQQAQRVLRRAGVDAVLSRTPRALEQLGCGYCLRLRPEHTRQALQLLQQDGVQFRKIYSEENDRVEEKRL